MLEVPVKKLLPYFAVTGVILAAGYAIYKFGYKNGSQDVQLAWNQDRAAIEASHNAFAAEMIELAEACRAKQESIANELVQARKEHEVAIAGQRADYDRRLLQSARRADMYQRQAEAGAIACRDLASHAARLDRALEEGRGLVLELSTTLGLREYQLKQLGAQLLSDRQLFTDTGDR